MGPFPHPKKEFAIAEETIAALACCGATMLVWTGLGMESDEPGRGIAGKRWNFKDTNVEPELAAVGRGDEVPPVSR